MLFTRIKNAGTLVTCIYVCLASIHISCGDVSDTCITGDRFDVCYYKNELTESDANRVLKAMQGFDETFSSKLKVNKDSDGQISAFIEINTNTSEEKQKAFLTRIANTLSNQCFNNASVRVVGVDDIDMSSGKGKVSAVSQ